MKMAIRLMTNEPAGKVSSKPREAHVAALSFAHVQLAMVLSPDACISNGKALQTVYQ